MKVEKTQKEVSDPHQLILTGREYLQKGHYVVLIDNVGSGTTGDTPARDYCFITGKVVKVLGASKTPLDSQVKHLLSGDMYIASSYEAFMKDVKKFLSPILETPEDKLPPEAANGFFNSDAVLGRYLELKVLKKTHKPTGQEYLELRTIGFVSTPKTKNQLKKKKK